MIHSGITTLKNLALPSALTFMPTVPSCPTSGLPFSVAGFQLFGSRNNNLTR